MRSRLLCRVPGQSPLSDRCALSDALIIILGTGGILMMAAYAALCERI